MASESSSRRGIIFALLCAQFKWLLKSFSSAAKQAFQIRVQGVFVPHFSDPKNLCSPVQKPCNYDNVSVPKWLAHRCVENFANAEEILRIRSGVATATLCCAQWCQAKLFPLWIKFLKFVLNICCNIFYSLLKLTYILPTFLRT